MNIQKMMKQAQQMQEQMQRQMADLRIEATAGGGMVKVVVDGLKQIHALAIDPKALAGSAYTSLGSLYYQVPGWPIGFGDDKKAREMLEAAGYEVTDQPDGVAGLRAFRESPADVVITDISMPRADGHAVLQHVRGHGGLAAELARQRPFGPGAVGEDAAAQTGASAQPFLGTGAERGVHPMARLAFLDTGEAHALDFKFFSDERIQICAAHEGVAAGVLGLNAGQGQLTTQCLQHFHREKRDLALVVFLVIEEPVAANTPSRHAFDSFDSEVRILPRWLAAVAEEIVAGRNEKVFDANHGGILHPQATVCKCELAAAL